jgi:hypothetical protein
MREITNYPAGSLAPNSFITCYLLFGNAFSVGPGIASPSPLFHADLASRFWSYWRAFFPLGRSGCAPEFPDPQQSLQDLSAADKRRHAVRLNPGLSGTTFVRSFFISTTGCCAIYFRLRFAILFLHRGAFL